MKPQQTASNWAAWHPAPPQKPEASNWRKWFKRIALTGWAIYALGMLLFPLWDEMRERDRAFHRNSASYQVCSAIAAKRGQGSQAECDSVFRARMDRDVEAYRLGSEYRAMGWHLAWVVPVALCAPLIFLVFAYGAILAFAKIMKACRNGFNQGVARVGGAPSIESFGVIPRTSRYAP